MFSRIKSLSAPPFLELALKRPGFEWPIHWQRRNECDNYDCDMCQNPTNDVITFLAKVTMTMNSPLAVEKQTAPTI